MSRFDPIINEKYSRAETQSLGKEIKAKFSFSPRLGVSARDGLSVLKPD
jgi:hypothetical protein